jgi:hypothetical protein
MALFARPVDICWLADIDASGKRFREYLPFPQLHILLKTTYIAPIRHATKDTCIMLPSRTKAYLQLPQNPFSALRMFDRRSLMEAHHIIRNIRNPYLHIS